METKSIALLQRVSKSVQRNKKARPERILDNIQDIGSRNFIDRIHRIRDTLHKRIIVLTSSFILLTFYFSHPKSHILYPTSYFLLLFSLSHCYGIVWVCFLNYFFRGVSRTIETSHLYRSPFVVHPHPSFAQQLVYS